MHLPGRGAWSCTCSSTRPYLPLAAKVGINFGVAVGLYLALSNAYLDRAHDVVATRTAAGLMTAQEAASLLGRRRRRQALQQAAAGAAREQTQARQERLLADIDSQAA